jgi:hypothetical protein
LKQFVVGWSGVDDLGNKKEMASEQFPQIHHQCQQTLTSPFDFFVKATMLDELGWKYQEAPHPKDLVDSYKGIDIFIAPSVTRRSKFVVALALSTPIVSPQWLIDSHRAGKLLPHSGYILSWSKEFDST